MSLWQTKQNNLNKWWDTCTIDNNKPYNIYDYFKLGKIKGSVLDVGCGMPKGTWYIDEFKDYTGIDPNPKDDRIINGVAENLPFENNIFDNVLFMSTLQHVEYPHIALGEIKRVAKHGAKLFSTVYCSKENNLILHEFDLESVKKLYANYFNIQRIEFKDNVVYVECLC